MITLRRNTAGESAGKLNSLCTAAKISAAKNVICPL